MCRETTSVLQVHALPLRENWKVGPPEETTYAIAITLHGQLIGAWLEKGTELHLVDICESPKGQEFGDLVKMTWGRWIVQQHLVNYDGSLYGRMRRWMPKHLLQAYFSAVNAHKDGRAYAMMSPVAQYQQITMNVPVGHLYNTSWDPHGDGLANWRSVRFVSLKPYHYINPSIEPGKQLPKAESMLYNARPAQERFYTVAFDATFYKVIVLNNGPGGFYTTLTKDTSRAPWLIAGFGTGP